ncbi:hypothetical protein ACFOND_04120 [Reinekea marina]|uniref:Glycosyl-4,4'-diaponeurosporenoate acyltransferase n=1 Tax=Reinekea marina TaxID=1310421 RepID=A0ABV7WP19_9GAMM
MSSYFEPKSFEKCRGKSIYSYLGIKFFKRYLLLPDIILFSFSNKAQLNTRDKKLKDEIIRLEWQTRRDEIIHLVFMALIVVILIKSGKDMSIFQWVAVFAINLFVNIYPIFLQRHNRMRLLKLLVSLSKRRS